MWHCLQMETYRTRLGPPDVAGPSSRTLVAPKTNLGYINLGLPSHLNVDDDSLNWADTSMEHRSALDEYRAYGFGVRSRIDVNLLKFWEVCTQSSRRCRDTQSSTGPWRRTPNDTRDRYGLPANPGICCSMRAGLFIQCGDRHCSPQPYQPCPHGGASNVKVWSSHRTL